MKIITPCIQSCKIWIYRSWSFLFSWEKKIYKKNVMEKRDEWNQCHRLSSLERLRFLCKLIYIGNKNSDVSQMLHYKLDES